MKTTFKPLHDFLTSNRKVGTTRLLASSVLQSPDVLVIVADELAKTELITRFLLLGIDPCQVPVIKTIDDDLSGIQLPVIIDPDVIPSIISRLNQPDYTRYVENLAYRYLTNVGDVISEIETYSENCEFTGRMLTMSQCDFGLFSKVMLFLQDHEFANEDDLFAVIDMFEFVERLDILLQ